ISTMLFGKSSYETCLCLGLMVDDDGQKMSKSRGNIVDPWEVLNTHGADAFRWYFFTSKQPWDGYRFSMNTVAESVRQFMLTLWNTYAFYVLYANLTEPEEREPTDLDRWIRSRLAATVEIAIERMASLVRDELNVKELRFVGQADELGRWELKPNYRALGPRFGKRMPRVADAVAALDAQRAAQTLRDGGTVGIVVDGEDHPL